MKLDSLRGEYRKLLERYATDSKHLTDFTSHEEKVIAYINSLNKQKQVLEEQLTIQQKNEALILSQCEEKYQNMDMIEQEKLRSVLIIHAKYSKSIRKQTIVLKDCENEYNEKVHMYEKILEEKRNELKFEMETLQKYESQHNEIVYNFFTTFHNDLCKCDDMRKKNKEVETKINKLTLLKNKLLEQIDEKATNS